MSYNIGVNLVLKIRVWLNPLQSLRTCWGTYANSQKQLRYTVVRLPRPNG